MKPTALITGITGQDGSYLAELLLQKGYEVHGIVRRVAVENPEHRMWRIRHILPRLQLHSAAMESYASLCQVVQKIEPAECYHLAGQSYVSYSFQDEFSTMQTNAGGTHNLLAALKQFAPACRFYFAASSEMFGKVQSSPQNEETPFYPRSTYAISKVEGFQLCRYYREAYGLFACSGILFNHESPRRGLEFVTRKITRGAARIKVGASDQLVLGNLAAQRDWGHARDYVNAMWAMLQQDAADDYAIATGQSHSVREFCEAAFACLDLDYRDWVTSDPRLFRPADVECLLGDCSKAQRILGWQSRTSWNDLVTEMVQSDLGEAGRESGQRVLEERFLRAV